MGNAYNAPRRAVPIYAWTAGSREWRLAETEIAYSSRTAPKIWMRGYQFHHELECLYLRIIQQKKDGSE